MPRIAISYRRSDSAAIAGRIFDRLSVHYGPESVFMDIDDIPIGADFRTHIQDKLKLADVLVTVIGAQWTGASGERAARIREPQDPVRVEVETALTRRVPIIPVLVDGARMPEAAELPETFGNFAFLNAADVTTGRDFHAQVDRLIGAIDRASGAEAPGALGLTTSKLKSEAPDARVRARKRWQLDLLMYLGVPSILLLIADFTSVDVFDLNLRYIWTAIWLLPFVFGFALRWTGGRGAATAAAFALALGVIAEAVMTVSQGLYSGDPILPETRLDWIEHWQFAGTIALSFMTGYVAALARRMLGRRLGMR